jgi:hypothetical protein
MIRRLLVHIKLFTKNTGDEMRMTHSVFMGLLFIYGVGDAKAATEMFEQYHGLQHMQEELHRLPPEKQERLQPNVRHAEHQACQKLREEQRKGVRHETYRQEGGDELVAFVQQFDYYCQTLE